MYGFMLVACTSLRFPFLLSRLLFSVFPSRELSQVASMIPHLIHSPPYLSFFLQYNTLCPSTAFSLSSLLLQKMSNHLNLYEAPAPPICYPSYVYRLHHRTSFLIHTHLRIYPRPQRVSALH
ncbi:uncharacterized protein LY89DRAFT_470346 [Mollisia scopiformis]|uniref:Secreted protein n=1 Tax=Mollisia scopiformis TaxID=149040 RepID=A0A194XIL6_MOLSC|nr:uncharacterized protein LY89DRAFT_470346 [Mollisia scopiformis]KUJ20075.1 hypothetical protein LY89DRAFT_470346 [Mollisia scopiformis]